MKLDAREIEKLRQLGLVLVDGAGNEALKVSLQNKGDLTGRSLAMRRKFLEDWRDQVKQALEQKHGMIEDGTLSLTGQCIEAVVSISLLRDRWLETEFAEIEVQPLISRQILPPE